MTLAAAFFTTPALALICLLGASTLAACSTALLKMGKFKSKELLRSSHASFFAFRFLFKKCCPQGDWENLHFALSISKHILQIAYALLAFVFLIAAKPSLQDPLLNQQIAEPWGALFFIGGCTIALSLLFDFLFRLFATLWSKQLFKFMAPIASIYLIILFPLIGLFIQLARGVLKKVSFAEEPLTDKTKLREMIRESELQHHLDLNDQKLI
ncbi:MAG TPA: hypothetical protein DCE71_03195, partial [Parachlamydiales bacterium]|nr:hypothetical protein [Parachlamydiales bacterium]